MLKKLTRNRGGFTLVEIMIVVAIIALLAAIAVPNFLRARKRSQATRILEDMRLIDQAIDQYAIETHKSKWDWASPEDISAYLKKGTALYSSAANGWPTDLFGNGYWYNSIDSDVSFYVNFDTYQKLSDVAPADFWSPYQVPN